MQGHTCSGKLAGNHIKVKAAKSSLISIVLLHWMKLLIFILKYDKDLPILFKNSFCG